MCTSAGLVEYTTEERYPPTSILSNRRRADTIARDGGNTCFSRANAVRNYFSGDFLLAVAATNDAATGYCNSPT